MKIKSKTLGGVLNEKEKVVKGGRTGWELGGPFLSSQSRKGERERRGESEKLKKDTIK
jgi:hypothetical protein